MAGVKTICDTGPIIAFFNARHQFHAWAKEQFKGIRGPLETCEGVFSEAVFLLHSEGLSADPIFEAVE